MPAEHPSNDRGHELTGADAAPADIGSRPADGRSFGAQLRRHSVALISLTVAVLALGYNTWRNETTEEQRNLRHAAFRVIEALGELQRVVDTRFYFQEAYARSDLALAESHLAGYGSAAMVRDLMMLMPEPAPSSGERLHRNWLRHFGKLDDVGTDGGRSESARQAEEILREDIAHARGAVLEVLRSLD